MAAVLDVLLHGEITPQGQFLWGSNATLLAEVRRGTERVLAVYKPVRGQRPLWDFPRETLPHREVAAFLVSEALGWHLVPPTAYRADAPYGAGSLQQFIDHDPEYHYFTFTPEDRARLRPVVLFDLLVNNADRKAGHVLRDAAGRLWLIDHGICFHEENKLRTVIWEFAGQPVPSGLRADLRRLQARLQQDDGWLRPHLSEAEIAALRARAARLAEATHFPHPPADRRAHPWPLV